jgi:2,5-furandicarboxylate decarboxylase 1
MNVGLRELLSRLEVQDQLYRIDRPVSLRHIPALIDQSDRAVCFTRVSGYSMPLISALMNDRQRLSIATRVPFAEIEGLLRRGMETPIPPVVVNDAVCQEVVLSGNDVDLTALPVPVFGESDGGPFITAGVTIGVNPNYGRNAGVYRFMLRDRTTVGIDVVTPNNLNTYCQRAFAAGRTVPIAVSIARPNYRRHRRRHPQQPQHVLSTRFCRRPHGAHRRVDRNAPFRSYRGHLQGRPGGG